MTTLTQTAPPQALCRCGSRYLRDRGPHFCPVCRARIVTPVQPQERPNGTFPSCVVPGCSSRVWQKGTMCAGCKEEDVRRMFSPSEATAVLPEQGGGRINPTDAVAIAGDWQTVGGDLQKAIETFEEKTRLRAQVLSGPPPPTGQPDNRRWNATCGGVVALVVVLGLLVVVLR